MTSSPLALLAAAALTLPAADALAQHCHVPTDAGTPAASSPAAPAVSRLAASFELVAGAADVMDARVAYQGLVLGLGAGWGRLDGRVALPLFHVEDEGTGLGDLVVGPAPTSRRRGRRCGRGSAPRSAPRPATPRAGEAWGTRWSPPAAGCARRAAGPG